MSKLIISQRYFPAKRSTTSDCQLDYGSSTAEPHNLAAMLRNNVVLFECVVAVSNIDVEVPIEKDHDKLKD